MEDNDEEDIRLASSVSFKFVPFNVIHDLAMLLDPHMVASCKDWRGVADKLGYNAQEIWVLESRTTPDGSNTKKLLKDYVSKPDNSVGEMLKALSALERIDAYEVLKKALPEIHQKKKDYELSQRQVGEPQQNSCDFQSMELCPPQRMIFETGHVYELKSDCSVKRMKCDSGTSLFTHHNIAQRTFSGCTMSVRNGGVNCLPLQMDSIPDHGDMNRSLQQVSMDLDQEECSTKSAYDWSSYQQEGVLLNNGLMLRQNSQEARLGRQNLAVASLSNVNSLNDAGCKPPSEVTGFDWNGHHPVRSVTPNSLPTDSCLSAPSPNQMRSTSSAAQLLQGSNLNSIMTTSKSQPAIPQTKQHSDTYPMSKGKQRSEIPKALRGVQEERALVAQYRAISEPRNLSPAPFNTARRETRIFITYANDGRPHLNRILSVVKNLRKNGFAVSCDMCEKEFVDISEESRDSWLKQRYNVADFIIVCVSPLYYQVVQSLDRGAVYERSMHEGFIYRLMEQEVQQTVSRFICLLLWDTSADHIPSLLRRHVPVYRWPTQHKDLLFKLIKPEQILYGRSKPLSSVSSIVSDDESSRQGTVTIPSSSGVRNPVVVRREVS